MKIKESKSIIIESDNAPLKISGRDGLSAYRVAKFHEKDNENIKHAVYRTPGGAYYNRYYVKDIYGDEDELGNKGVVGPFTSEGDAVARLKDYKKDVVKESYRGRRRIRESKELDRKAFVSLVKLGNNPYDGYSILNDGYFVKRIYAESDEDAIRQFRDYLARKNEGLQERNLTSAERYNRNAERIFKDFDARNERMAQFLKDYGVSDDEIAELKKHVGLGHNALDDKMSELGIRKDFFDIEDANDRAERQRADAEAKQKEMIKNLKWAKGFTTKEAKDWIKSHGSDEARKVINKALYPNTEDNL